MTGAAIAARLGLARSTVSRWLGREGLGRLAQIDPPEPVRRYQRERPGELIHLDIKKLGRLDQPGHRVTGTRVGCRNRGACWDFVHVAVDDATRLAYVEVLADERKNTTTGFLLRALRWFRTRGIHAERVMTDNGSACRSRRFAKALRWLHIRHIFTRPHSPKDQRKGRKVHTNPPARMGLRPRSPLIRRTKRRPAQMAGLVQQNKTTLRSQRPLTHRSGEQPERLHT
jgi:transposase InsO family protein